MRIELYKTLATNAPADERDVRLVQKTLNHLGYYQPPEEIGITGIPEARLFDSLTNFQIDHGLEPTGTIKPEDETIRTLNREVDKGQSGKYVWRTVEDDHVRAEHAVLNRTLRNWGSSPEPGEDFNCRCWIELVADSDIEREELKPPQTVQPVIPGTNIPDNGIPEQGWPSTSGINTPRDNKGRAVLMPPTYPPAPYIDPRMELPYDPHTPKSPKRHYDL